MAKAMMANPELRNPFAATAIHPEGSATVLYQGKKIVLSETGVAPEKSKDAALLISPDDLPKVNGFTVKPEGACFEDLCIPLNKDLLVETGGRKWFNLTAFADLLEQPWVADSEAKVWSFAEIPAKRENTMVNAMAPDFEVTDRKGNVIRMADLKGKKALIVTWSSW